MRGKKLCKEIYFGSTLLIILRYKAINKNTSIVVTNKRYSRKVTYQVYSMGKSCGMHGNYERYLRLAKCLIGTRELIKDMNLGK